MTAGVLAIIVFILIIAIVSVIGFAVGNTRKKERELEDEKRRAKELEDRIKEKDWEGKIKEAERSASNVTSTQHKLISTQKVHCTNKSKEGVDAISVFYDDGAVEVRCEYRCEPCVYKKNA